VASPSSAPSPPGSTWSCPAARSTTGSPASPCTSHGASTRTTWSWRVAHRGLPVARSAVDAAAWQPHVRYATAVLAAVVQQRLVTARELDVAALCRRFDLRPPERQRVRRDRDGRRRYLDCEWRLDDGRLVVLEVDGAHHATVASWEDDMRRERQVVAGGRAVLRASAERGAARSRGRGRGPGGGRRTPTCQRWRGSGPTQALTTRGTRDRGVRGGGRTGARRGRGRSRRSRRRCR